jgi:HAE1 family hydrophobic/amphiphilic exporter-1/multidrug efflux pump
MFFVIVKRLFRQDQPDRSASGDQDDKRAQEA